MSGKSAPRPSGPRRSQGLSQGAITRRGQRPGGESGATAREAQRAAAASARPGLSTAEPSGHSGTPALHCSVIRQRPRTRRWELASGATNTYDRRPQPDHPQRDAPPLPAPNAPPRKRGSRRLRPPKALRAHSRWDHRMAPDLGANLNVGRPPPGAAPPASS